MEANRARIEAQVAQVRYAPAAFDTVKISVACPRIRVSVPRITTGLDRDLQLR
jgi:hypothetical protein